MSRLPQVFASFASRQSFVLRHSSLVLRAAKAAPCVLLACVLLTLPPSPAFAQLTEQKTPGVRVVYVDGTESFLVPQVTRTALNSLKFQKNIFGFDPKKDPLVLLVDLSDKGNAGASTVPGDLVTVQIAPIAFIYETIATNERMNTLMNHEFVHIATMDSAAGHDRLFRRLF